jgi:flagellar protein FliL
MAEEEKQEEVKEESGSKKSPMMIIIIAVVVVLLALIGAVVAILLSGGEDGSVKAPVAQEASAEGSEGGGETKKKAAYSGSEKAFTELGPMFPLDTFTVNLLSESGRRYLKVEINLELSGEEVAVELDSRQAAIRDIIIRLLSSKSLEEISTTKGKEKLKEQILDQLNIRLKDGHINNVYFTNFVIQ